VIVCSVAAGSLQFNPAPAWNLAGRGEFQGLPQTRLQINARYLVWPHVAPYYTIGMFASYTLWLAKELCHH
jgi:hypothetical protein